MDDCGAEDDNSLWNEVIYFVNNNFVDSSKFLQQLEIVEQSLEKDRKYLENQLSLMQCRKTDQESQTEVGDKVADAKLLISEMDILCEKVNDLSNYESEIKDIKTTKDNIENIDKCVKYLHFINHLEEESSFIQSSMLIENMDQSVNRFSSLATLLEQIKHSKCDHLKRYTESIVLYWYKIFMSTFSVDMEMVMQSFGWPFIVTSGKQNIPTNAEQHINKFHTLIKLLMKIQLPECCVTRVDPVFQCSTKHYISLPTQFFLAPFQKRFSFHFYGNKKTNSIEKPEWYYTQLTMWLNDHKEFIVNKLQPHYDRAGYGHVDVLIQFSEGLICLAADKLHQDLNSLLNDTSGADNDQLFAHHIDEALVFYNELQVILSYSAPFNGIFKVLVSKQIFDKWIAVEKSYALRRMDSMLEMADAWLLHSVEGDVDDCKIPHFTELFLILMMTIQDRYRHLPNLNSQLDFSKLQLYLIDDFRIRLAHLRKQLSSSSPQQQQHITENSKFAAILNTVTYVCEVLRRWANEPLFVKLNYHKRKLEKELRREGKVKVERSGASGEDMLEETGTIFDGMIELYEGMKVDMLKNILFRMVEDFKINCKPYRRDKWLALPSHKEFVSLALSNSACHMLKTLKVQLDAMETLLSSSLFNVLWREVADQLDEYIYNDVITANHFNEGGAMQLNHDMVRNLFPMFSSYTSKPENHFKCVKEACHILTMTSGSAMLIGDVLKRALHASDSKIEVSDPIAALQDLGIFKLEPEHVEKLLNLRIDLQY